MLADVRGGGVRWPRWVGAVILGVAPCRLLSSGIVDHKLLGVRGIWLRRGPAHDLGVDGTAMVLVLVGCL
ncbi:hypothetical protein QJS66_16700 [Kocuria rhizophila]|nr:hypothetical protein QJS66_16700 [Kocuria rhizophila]